MKKILDASLLWRWLTAAAGWIDRQWRKSRFARLLEGSGVSRDSGITGRAGHALHMALCAVFRFLRLDRLLDGSVFRQTFFWVALTALLAPLLPTMAVLALELAALAAVAAGYGLDRERRAVRAPLNRWVLLFAVIYMASTLFSVTPGESLRGGLLMTAFALFALAVTDVCRDRRLCVRLIQVIVFSGTLVALYGIAQSALGLESTEKWVDLEEFENISLRVYSTLGNPNVLSEYLLLTTPLAAACALNARTVNGRIAGGFATAAMLGCLVLTWSRGGWLGIVLAAAVFLIIMDRRFAVLGVLGAAGLLALAPASIMARLASIGSMADSSTSYRVYIWQATLNLLRDYWMFGIGTGITAFQSIYPQYSFNAVSAPHSHNLFLQMACECGAPGLLAILGVFASCVRGLCGGMTRTDRRGKVWLAALLSSLVGFFFQSMTDYSFYNYRVALTFWTVAGLAAAMAVLAGDRGEQT